VTCKSQYGLGRLVLIGIDYYLLRIFGDNRGNASNQSSRKCT